MAELDDFEATRDAAVERRDRALANLAVWLETCERNPAARVATVLCAHTQEEAARLIVAIARRHSVRKVAKAKSTKAKSTLSEEIGLIAARTAARVQPVETDLGKHIRQINDNEAPSHIIAPGPGAATAMRRPRSRPGRAHSVGRAHRVWPRRH